MAQVLVVEDDRTVAENLKRHLEKRGHKVELSYSEKTAIDRIQREHFDVVLVDMFLEEEDSGIRILETAKKCKPPKKVVILTAYGSDPNRESAMRLGADGYLEKHEVKYEKVADDISKAANMPLPQGKEM